jgi:transcriptional regulator with XRE-family HTH domain
MATDTNDKIHQGRNIKRFREMLGIKQEAFATELGEDWTQKKVSLLEQKETIEPDLLEQVAKVLKVPVEAIKNFDEEAAIVYFNTFNDSSFSHSNGAFSAHQCTFNPLDKYIEQVEQNKKLYERLLESEREKVEILKKIVDGKK